MDRCDITMCLSLFCFCFQKECVDKYKMPFTRDQARGRLGRDSRPRGRNFPTKKKKKNIFFGGDSFSISHHTNASCGDIIRLHHDSPSIKWQ